MASTIKVDNINKVSDNSNIIKKCGSTTTVGSGSGQTIVVDGATVTLGRCGGAVNLASGASQTGFGRTGTVDWCSTVYTNSPGTVTGVSGKGYFLNTTSGEITINLPSSPSFGDIISIKDYANTFDSNTVTIGRNGSKINGVCACATLNTQSQSVTLIYVDSTKGWQSIQDGTSDVTGNAFISATGGCVTTSGNYKIHTFNSDANFVVTKLANAPADNAVDYLVVAGGGGIGSTNRTGGGGGGGVRASAGTSTGCYTAGPLAACVAAITVTTSTYPITVGAGGAARSNTPEVQGTALQGNDGANSVFSTITSAGGGGSGTVTNPGGAPTMSGKPGGSGGGGAAGNGTYGIGGTGNTPPVSPPQGNNGGAGVTPSSNYSGGGGGATNAGSAGDGSTGGDGGAGLTSCISGSPVGYGGGGGGGVCHPSHAAGSASPCGSGAAGINTPGANANNGATNRGGGGGGLRNSPGNTGGAGGSGVVIIRYKYQ